MRRKHLTTWKEMMLSLCVWGLSLIPPTPLTVQQPWKNSVASMAKDKEAPMRRAISVQIYMI